MLVNGELRVYVQEPRLGGVHLILSHGGAKGVELPVQVREADPVVVDEVQGPDAAAPQSLHGVASHAPDAENGHTGAGEPLHALRAEKQLRS